MKVWLVEKWNRQGTYTWWDPKGIFSSRELAVDYCVDQGWPPSLTHIRSFVLDGKVPVEDV